MNTAPERVAWLDLTRAVAISGVVLIHAIVPLLYDYDKKSAPDWWAGNLFDSPVRMSVPLFVMISGALLLGKVEAPHVFVWRRLPKLIFPLLVWGSVYKFLFPSGATPPNLGLALSEIIQGHAHFHLWFMYLIIGLYFVIPIFQVLIQAASDLILYYFLALWFLAATILPFIQRFADLNINLDLAFATGYTGYLILGYLMSRISLNKNIILVSAIVYLFSVAATAAANYVLTLAHQGNFDGYFRDYLSPTVIPMSASFFLLMKSLGQSMAYKKLSLLSSWVYHLSAASYGIYLVHIIPLSWLTNRFEPFENNPVFMVPANWVLTMLLSFIFVFTIRKIPVLKATLP